MADRGLRAYAVPSARVGERSDPAARRDAVVGLLTAGFLLAVIAAVLTIVVATPEYAAPASVAEGVAIASARPSPNASASAARVEAVITTSKPPHKLKGYRWPVRGGQVDTYYDWDGAGRFMIDGRRVHAGLVITWFEGATVKAAHKGSVVAVGRDWASHIGYDGPLDDVYERLARKQGKQDLLGVVIDDGNAYYSVYTALKDITVEIDDTVEAGQVIGRMSRAEGRQMMRYQLVRTDGPWMKVHLSDRRRGYPKYIRELVDPLVVMNLQARKAPSLTKRPPPADPPRLSEYP